MGKEVKSIGVLTSGGDAPGMNAAIRSVVRSALTKGIKVYGIYHGYNGLMNGGDEITEFNFKTVSNIIQKGGTALYSARSERFKTEEGMNDALATCDALGIDGLVVIGGDGSYRGARDLSLKGIPCVALPGTIDNDIASTDETIGYDTAMNTAVEMIDKLRDTLSSHDRCSVVEVMGRHCGDIALRTGIACGSTSIILPEKDYDFERDIVEPIMRGKKLGKSHFIIIIAEGLATFGTLDMHELAAQVEEATGVCTRATTLGHVQRGGSPTVRDRVLATSMGHHAVELLSQGIGNRVVCLRNNEIIDMDIYEALNMDRVFNDNLYKIAEDVSI